MRRSKGRDDETPLLAQNEFAAGLKTEPPAARATLSIGFVLVPEFTFLPFAAFIDALRIVGDSGYGSRQIRCRWTIMGKDLGPVASSCGVAVTPWERFRDPRRFDYIVVVGGLLHKKRFDDGATLDYLKRAARAGTPLVGLCTASFVLARAGLMTGKRACIHWLHSRRWASEFPDLEYSTDDLFIIDGDRITSAGGTAVIELAARIIGDRLGAEQRVKIMQFMMVDDLRPPTHRQSHFPGDIGDERVRRAVLLMEQHMEAPLTLSQISSRVDLSSPQLNRAFRRALGTSPASYARHLRLQHGRWLLANTELPVTDVAYKLGFADASHFSRWCRREFGATPLRLRKRRVGGQ